MPTNYDYLISELSSLGDSDIASIVIKDKSINPLNVGSSNSKIIYCKIDGKIMLGESDTIRALKIRRLHNFEDVEKGENPMMSEEKELPLTEIYYIECANN